MSQTHQESKYIGKAIATLAAAWVCAVMLKQTAGEHGIGWFVIAVVIIW